MNRREFLKACGMGVALLAGRSLLAGEGGGLLLAAAGKTRPPGTCGGYTDADADGICEHSVKKVRPCGAVRCPGNARNAKRAKLAGLGAPAGVCAEWKDPQKKGFCAVCTEAKPCLYTRCPAHKDHPTAEGTV